MKKYYNVCCIVISGGAVGVRAVPGDDGDREPLQRGQWLDEAEQGQGPGGEEPGRVGRDFQKI